MRPRQTEKMSSRRGQLGRRTPFGIVAVAAALAGTVALLAQVTTFVSQPVALPAQVTTFVSQPRQALRLQSARRAMPKPAAPEEAQRVETEAQQEDTGDEDEEIELSPAEYQAALKAEMDREKRKYYVTGENGKQDSERLIVPWKQVNDAELEATARERLLKDGIYDPSKMGADKPIDSDVSGSCVGQDVYLEWTLNDPGSKIGYIVEKKPAQGGTYFAIASYEEQKWQQLLVRQETSNQEFFHYDTEPEPGDYMYRLLVRDRGGEVKVVGETAVNVPESAAVPIVGAGAFFFVLFFGGLLFLYFRDAQDGY